MQHLLEYWNDWPPLHVLIGRYFGCGPKQEETKHYATPEELKAAAGIT